MSVAIVTGASTGIGRAIAQKLGVVGHDVVVNSLTDTAGGATTIADLEALGRRAIYVRGDVSKDEVAHEIMTRATERLGNPTILVNNAGATRSSDLGSWTAEHWHDMLSTNLVTTATMSQAFVSVLPISMEGAIVNIASMRGLPYAPRIAAAAYSAAKAGVVNLTAALARELAPRVTVNCVSPGFVETDYMSRVSPEMKASWHERMPIKRFIRPDEVASVVVTVVETRAMTGSNIVVDGGWSIGAG